MANETAEVKVVMKPVGKIWLIGNASHFGESRRIYAVRSSQQEAEQLVLDLREQGFPDWDLRLEEVDVSLLDRQPEIAWRATVNPMFKSSGRGMSVRISRDVAYGDQDFFTAEWGGKDDEMFGGVSFLLPDGPEEKALRVAVRRWEQLKPEWDQRQQEVEERERAYLVEAEAAKRAFLDGAIQPGAIVDAAEAEGIRF